FLAWNVIERALDGQRTEDSRIELKAVYPHPANRAARQLAGHANAARSDWILWVIGVDERSNTITGAEFVEHANWLNEVKSNFEHADLAPQLLESLSLPVRDANKTIVALLFDTSRAPYVVVNERFGQPGAKTKVKWEVP